jgi:hypothetical protein
MKHSLAAKGLSLSQAQSISNLCNQRCRDIQFQIDVINNAEKTITIGDKDYLKVPAHPIPFGIVDTLNEKARLSATQAFLMENIKAKDALIRAKQTETFHYTVDRPESPEYHSIDELEMVGESWGWDQLTAAQWQEYLEAEAFASHIGQFIHRGGKLDRLRTELPAMELLEWEMIEEGKRTPVEVNPHHTMEDLGDLHEDLSAIHRAHEQRVNYFKAMVKNAVTIENARRIRVNSDEQARVDAINESNRAVFDTAYKAWSADRTAAMYAFNEERQKEIARLSALRIEVPARFQPVVDEFLKDTQE